jgi:enoyl-CoA hydratase
VWAADDRVATVLIDGAGDRSFCAGADIRVLRDSAIAGDARARIFFAEEYILNARIARYAKPVVAILDGIAMGGGIGLACHASHRVGTDRLSAAMPEAGIGFTPDVGSTFLLSRAPGELGTHLALTGAVVGAKDAALCGLVDTVIGHTSVPTLIDAFRDGDHVAALDDAQLDSVPSSPGELAQSRSWIDHCYAQDQPADILDRLERHGSEDARAAAGTIRSRSPTSVTVGLRALRQARALPSLEACLDQEFRVSCRFLSTPDFVEGIRAQIVDKDRNPRWSPRSLADVAANEVDRYFADLGGEELGLSNIGGNQ